MIKIKKNDSKSQDLQQEERRIDLALKRLEVEEQTERVRGWEVRRLHNEEISVQAHIIDSLRWLLEANCVDEERSMPGMDAVYRPVFSEQESAIIRRKILELVSQL